jgi:flagellar basal-body rod modification protein FlgD
MTPVTRPIATNAAQNAEPSRSKKNEEMGKDDFLKLLVTQLRYQDPLKPMDDTQFVSQMAQFSSLEQMHNLNTTSLLNQATGLIGKNVTWAISDGDTRNGIVKSVKIVDGQPKLAMDNLEVDLKSISGQIPNNPLELIGQKVTWNGNMSTPLTANVLDVTEVNGVKKLIVEGQVVDLADVHGVQNSKQEIEQAKDSKIQHPNQPIDPVKVVEAKTE